MDPVGVLGAVAAAIQFIEFTGQLVYGTVKIFRGGSSQVFTLKTVTAGLQKQSQALQQSLQNTSQSATGSNEMRELCERCQKLAEKLLKALEKLEKDDKTSCWNSFLIALRSVCSKGATKELMGELDVCRQHMGLFLVHSIWQV